VTSEKQRVQTQPGSKGLPPTWMTRGIGAPAILQTSTSSKVFVIITLAVITFFSKIRRLRSFQISQHTRLASITMVLRRSFVSFPTKLLYQLWKLWCVLVQELGFNSSWLSVVTTDDQTFKLYGHSVSRCVVVSRFLRHKGQKYSFSQRRSNNLSVVKTRSSIRVYMKNLHLAGAHPLQMIFL
jgi:hypothetical protein